MRAPKPQVQVFHEHAARDVEMESVEGDNSHDDFDPGDLDVPSPSPAAVATAAAGTDGLPMIQRLRISAISDLKEFTGKDQDEDRARAWISKGKSALMRDQASDAENGASQNWYRQLSRSTRNKWSDLLRSFQTQYCGLGLSVARQYYHARRRSDESPLEYLHRLNVAGLRAKLKIKDGGSKVLRGHVDHFIETLGDVDLADRLTLLRLPDADELEVLRAVDRAKHRQKKAAVGSGKYRQKAPTPTAPARRVHQVTAPDSETESGSDGSDSDPEDYRRVCLTASNDRTVKTGDNSRPGDNVPGDRGMYRSRDLMDETAQVRCSQCGSRKHTESGCWNLEDSAVTEGEPEERSEHVLRDAQPAMDNRAKFGVIRPSIVGDVNSTVSTLTTICAE
ncbi:hypothetical protein PInf_018700 [Phytophthora infestans]|nr:hypothetical protein PInf_018700 [Phytophthora infestans]